jgi:protein-disulfide isomerase
VDRGEPRVNDIWNLVSSLVVTAAAVVMLGIYLHDRDRGGASVVVTMPDRVEDWRDWRDAGVRVGPENAEMVIAAFMDFSCSFCGGLALVLDSVLEAHPEDVAFQFHHFPRPGQDLAMESAVAAECAQQQGRFVQMLRLLFSRRDLVEERAWSALAEETGVSDGERFSECIAAPPEAFARIGAGIALGERIGIIGTPSVYVNGALFTDRRSVAAFERNAEKLGLVW